MSQAWYSASAQELDSEWAQRFERAVRLANERLNLWASDPGALEAEGMIVPTSAAMDRARVALDRVRRIEAARWTLDAVTLGGGGEISIELSLGSRAWTLVIDRDCSMEWLRFQHQRLVHRERLP